MHGLDHALVLLRAGNGEHLRVPRRDLLRLGAHATGHDHLAVVGECFADCGKRFRLRAVEEAASVDDGEIGPRVRAGKFISLGAQARDDALAVDQRLRTAEGDEAHLRRALHGGCGMLIFHGRGA